MRLYQIQKSKMPKEMFVSLLGLALRQGKWMCVSRASPLCHRTLAWLLWGSTTLQTLNSVYKMLVSLVFKSEHNHTLSASPSPKCTTILKVVLCLGTFHKTSFFDSTVWDDYYLGLTSMYFSNMLHLNKYIVIILIGYMAYFQAAALNQLIIKTFFNLSSSQRGDR